jgi:hypothetical protein
MQCQIDFCGRAFGKKVGQNQRIGIGRRNCSLDVETRNPEATSVRLPLRGRRLRGAKQHTLRP